MKLKNVLYKKKWFAYLVLGIALLLTTFASIYAIKNIEDVAKRQFYDACDKVTIKIQERLSAYALILRGGAGVFAVSKSIDRQDWKSYVEKLNTSKSFPGIQGIGFAKVIPADQLAKHIVDIRSEGFPDYTVHPMGMRSTYTTIIYLEPFRNRNLRAFGFDMFSEPVRRKAMEQARDSGESAMSGKVKLLQETDQDIQAGALMYVPIYRNAALTDTVEHRRAALVGWVYSPYRISDLMEGILNDWNMFRNKSADLHIYDGIKVSPENLLFDKISRHVPSQASKFYCQRTINFNDHQWLLTFDLSRTNEEINYAAAWLVLAGGLTLSGLIFGLILSITQTQTHAAEIAAELTKETMLRKKLLQESEFRWKFAIEGAGVGLWDWNIHDNSVFFSKRWKEMFGYSENEVGNGLDEWEKRLHPDDKINSLASVQSHFEGKDQFYSSEHRLLCRSGRYKWTLARGMIVNRSSDGTPLRMIGTQTDITERKQAESLALEYSAQLNAIFSLSPDGFISFDSALNIKYVSPAFERLTGLNASQIIGLNETSFSELIALQCTEQKSFSGIADLRLKNIVGTSELKERLQKIELRNETHRILEIGLREAKTENVSQILYIRDITLETQIENMKSDFLSTAAHELRTPMASIYGYAELLLAQEFSEDEKRDFMGVILNQSKLMSSILNELLDLARIEAMRDKDFIITRVDIYELVREIVSCLCVPNGRQLPKVHMEKGALWIDVDRIKIIQVINNVLSNAYKYSPQGGDVKIEFIVPTATTQPEIEGHQSLIGIRITDHGIGMTSKQTARVFERFYRADTSGKISGTGLGMSIVNEIVKLHHGNVAIVSTIDKGTSVTIWLPFGTQKELISHLPASETTTGKRL